MGTAKKAVIFTITHIDRLWIKIYRFFSQKNMHMVFGSIFHKSQPVYKLVHMHVYLFINVSRTQLQQYFIAFSFFVDKWGAGYIFPLPVNY